MATTTRCARCGTEIEAGTYLCPRCREEEGPSVTGPLRLKPPSDLEARAGRWPSWMSKPSPVQYHATVMITVFLVLAGLAAFAFLSHRGVGPFTGRAVRVTSRPPSSLAVEAVVRNRGSKAARANCRIVALVDRYVESSATILTDEIPAHGATRIHDILRGVDAPPTTVAVNCS
ncbi:MAG: hypothetical protein ABR600_13760 [Actinomycetota bacterium]